MACLYVIYSTISTHAIANTSIKTCPQEHGGLFKLHVLLIYLTACHDHYIYLDFPNHALKSICLMYILIWDSNTDEKYGS